MRAVTIRHVVTAMTRSTAGARTNAALSSEADGDDGQPLAKHDAYESAARRAESCADPEIQGSEIEESTIKRPLDSEYE